MILAVVSQQNHTLVRTLAFDLGTVCYFRPFLNQSLDTVGLQSGGNIPASTSLVECVFSSEL